MARSKVPSRPNETTRRASERAVLRDGRWQLETSPPAVALTIAGHPDAQRIGERSFPFENSKSCELSRHKPAFSQPGSQTAFALNDPFVSRRPSVLKNLGNKGVQIVPNPDAAAIIVNGDLLDKPCALTRQDLAAGVVLEIGNRVVLVMHMHQEHSEPTPSFELIGNSFALTQLRTDILRVADLDVPVLLQGESGTGKELTAQAIHGASQRQLAPCICINMATLSPATASSQLFGHTKGAFTGASQAHDGLFVSAHGGTLFLDEIGTTPIEVQTMLLRALETGEVLPVGGTAPRKVDVRLITATDLDLNAACNTGAFLVPLLHRISGYRIPMPPLRSRRDDIGLLFIHFLREQLALIDHSQLLEPDEDEPWLPASVLAKLIRYDWHGNIRQLKNVARQIAISSRGSSRLRIDASVMAILQPPDGVSASPVAGQIGTATTQPSGGGAGRKPGNVSEDELVAALQANAWRLGPAAKALGISKSSLYALIDRSDRLRRASEIGEDEILASQATYQGDATAMAAHLEVSERALLFRMKELGLK